MTTSLGVLLADRALGLRLLTGSAETAVDWVHSSDLSDPTPFLEAGNLLLTTGTQFGDASAAAYAAYVQRLSAVGVAALGFGTEVVRSTPERLVTACRDQGQPLLEVPYRTPFIAISRRIAEARAAQAHARDLWALDAQRALSLAALSAERIAAVLAELSRRLPAEVVLLDAGGDVLSEHGRQRLDADGLRTVRTEGRRLLHRRLRSGSAVNLPGRTVTMQTLGRRDELRGVLAVALPGRPDASATAVITSAVALAELAASDAAERQEATLGLNAQLLQLAVAGHVAAAREVVAAAGRQLPEPPLRLLLVPLRADVDPGDLEHTLTFRAARARRPVLATRWQGRFVAVVEDPAVDDAVDTVRARQTPVAVSRPIAWGELAAALHEAREALDGAAQDAGVIELRSSAILGLLSRTDVEPLARERLARLDAAADGAELRRVLETWLRHNAAWDPAARELGRHRHTLKAQVHRAGALLGQDLDSFEAKAELWALLAASGIVGR